MLRMSYVCVSNNYMAEKSKYPRSSRSYKTTDKVYKRAIRRAKKEGNILSQLVELFVISYGNGTDIGYEEGKGLMMHDISLLEK